MANARSGMRHAARWCWARIVAAGVCGAVSSGCARGEALDGTSGALDDTSDAAVGGSGGRTGVGGQGVGAVVGSGGAMGSGGAGSGGASQPEVAGVGGASPSGGMHANGGASPGGGMAGAGGAIGAGGSSHGGTAGAVAGGTAGAAGTGGTLTGGAFNAGGKGNGMGGSAGASSTGGVAGSSTGGTGAACKNYPTNDACSLCICANCASQVDSCYDSADSVKNTDCAKIEACAEQNHCASSPCYCGSASLCLGANGPCKSLIETVDGTTDALTINNDGNDTSRALGRANAIGLCSTKACKSECNLP